MGRDDKTSVTRRALGVGLAGTLLVSACSTRNPLRIVAHPWPGYDLVKLGIAETQRKPRDLRWTAVDTVQESLSQLKNGKADGACLTLDQMLVARSQGIPLCAYLIFDISAGADTVLARPGIQGLAGLKGSKIGVEDSSLGVIMLAKLLEAAGVSRSEVSIVSMDENHFAAWGRKDLDFIITYEPSLGRLLRLGLEPVFDSRQMPRLIVDLLAIKPRAASAHGDTVAWVVQTHFLLLDEMRTNPADVFSRLSILEGISPADVATAFRGLDFPDSLYNRRLLSSPTVELTSAAEQLQALLVGAGLVNGRPEQSDLFSPRYLPKARL